MHVLQAMIELLATLSVPRTSTIIFSIYLVYMKREHFRVYIVCECVQFDSIFGGEQQRLYFKMGPVWKLV